MLIADHISIQIVIHLQKKLGGKVMKQKGWNWRKLIAYTLLDFDLNYKKNPDAR